MADVFRVNFDYIKKWEGGLSKDTRDPANDYQASMIKSSIEALEKVIESEEIDKTLLYENYVGDNPKLVIHGVEVSVYPDLIVRSSIRSKEYAGALKLHLSKNSSNSEEGDKYIAAMLFMFGQDFLKIEDSEMSRCALYLSYDVFADTFTECPKSITRRREDIEAGCQNIAAIWKTI